GQRGVTCRCRTAQLIRDSRRTHRVEFIIHKEEKLVWEDRSADLSAKAVAVKTRIHWRYARTGIARDVVVDGVEVTVLEVLVQRTVEAVCAAFNDLVELAARRMAELGAEIVLHHGEVGDGIIGNREQRTSDRLAVVVNTFNGKVVVTRTLAAH